MKSYAESEDLIIKLKLVPTRKYSLGFCKYSFKLLLFSSGIAHYFLSFFKDSMGEKKENQERAPQSGTSSVKNGRF